MLVGKHICQLDDCMYTGLLWLCPQIPIGALTCTRLGTPDPPYPQTLAMPLLENTYVSWTTACTPGFFGFALKSLSGLWPAPLHPTGDPRPTLPPNPGYATVGCIYADNERHSEPLQAAPRLSDSLFSRMGLSRNADRTESSCRSKKWWPVSKCCRPP